MLHTRDAENLSHQTRLQVGGFSATVVTIDDSRILVSEKVH